MAITAAICTSYKKEILDGLHQGTASGASAAADTFKMALYTSSATLGAATTAYSATNEVSGTNYSAGGVTLSGNAVGSLGIWAYMTFTDAVFTNISLPTNQARGALIYNSTRSNKAVAVLDFGSDKAPSSADLTVDLGQATSGAVTNINFANADSSINRTDAGSFVTDGFKAGHTIITGSATNPGPFVISTVAAAKIVCTTAVVTEANAIQTIKEVTFAM